MNQCHNNHCHCHEDQINQTVIQKLWDKIRATFASKEDLRDIVDELQHLNETQIKNIQSGFNGPLATVAGNTAQLRYENWVETVQQDAEGNPQYLYNQSHNALTTCAAAQILKEFRSKVDEGFRIKIVLDTDDKGRPAIDSPDFKTLYLVPLCSEDKDNMWDEWIAVPRHINNPNLRCFRWNHIGVKHAEIQRINQSIEALNVKIDDLHKRINNRSKQMIELILNRAIKPIEDIQREIIRIQEEYATVEELNAVQNNLTSVTNYLGNNLESRNFKDDIKNTVLSNEITNAIVVNIPRATEERDGLMSAEYVKWISKPAGEEGSGAISENDLNDLWG